MSVSIEASQVASTAVKGTLLQVGGWSGTIILFMNEWSTTFTALMGMASFLMSVWYFRRMVHLKESETDAGYIARINSDTIKAPLEHKAILELYFPS